MRAVIDTNILLSALIDPHGLIECATERLARAPRYAQSIARWLSGRLHEISKVSLRHGVDRGSPARAAVPALGAAVAHSAAGFCLPACRAHVPWRHATAAVGGVLRIPTRPVHDSGGKMRPPILPAR